MVTKMPRSPEHDYAIRTLNKRLLRLVPDSFTVSNQCAATLNDSEPEPDFTVARGGEATYRTHHPGPADTALVIEVSAASLSFDRTDKARVYARAGIPVYWVVNVIDKQIEVLTQPSGPGDSPAYAQSDVFAVGTSAPVVLDGNTVGTIAVADVMG
jgi:Uma2 family endonuclease